MTRYRLFVAYDGTAYAGWQMQPSAATVQGTLQGAIRLLTSQDTKVHGSGRTDQGVHARRQVAHFDLQDERPSAALQRGMNAVLPADIRINSLRTTDPSFHARRSAVAKEYRYFIWNSDIVPPFLYRYRTHIRHALDVTAMRQAAEELVGRHDFAAFTANPNRLVESTVRNLASLSVRSQGSQIVISARADGFLYKMVRTLAGLLIKVGEGSVPPSKVLDILNSRVRTARVPTAQPQGLFLWQVWYPATHPAAARRKTK